MTRFDQILVSLRLFPLGKSTIKLRQSWRHLCICTSSACHEVIRVVYVAVGF